MTLKNIKPGVSSSVTNAQSIADRIKTRGTMVKINLFLQMNKERILQGIDSALSEYTIDDLTAMIANNVAIPVSDEDIEKISEFSDMISSLKPEYIIKTLLSLVEEVRPDMVEAINLIGENAYIWLAQNLKMIMDKVINPNIIQKTTVQKNSVIQFVEVTCENCQKGFRIKKEDSIFVKMCPFCGHSGETQDGSNRDNDERAEPGSAPS